jgi:hypothetical protein
MHGNNNNHNHHDKDTDDTFINIVKRQLQCMETVQQDILYCGWTHGEAFRIGFSMKDSKQPPKDSFSVPVNESGLSLVRFWCQWHVTNKEYG